MLQLLSRVLTISLHSAGANYTSYELAVLCDAGGIYEAIYRNSSAPPDLCIHSCLFIIIEVTETRSTELLEAFASFRKMTSPLAGFI